MPRVKLQGPTVTGGTVGVHQQNPQLRVPRISGRMVGDANECEVILEDIACRALLDTGSTISTVSQKFYQSQLHNLPLHPIEDFLHIECAGGQSLQYMGYIEADVCVPELDMHEGKPLILLVVADTQYNAKVPLLLGTNILRALMETCRGDKGQQFLQKVATSTPWWLTFRCLSLEERAITRAKGKLGLVKCASPDTIQISSNSTKTVSGFVTDSVPCMRLAMVHPTDKTVLPPGIELMPTMINHTGCSAIVHVEVSNPTSRPILIQPRSVLCELQEVEVEDLNLLEKQERQDDRQDSWSLQALDDGAPHTSDGAPHTAENILHAQNQVLQETEQAAGPSESQTSEEFLASLTFADDELTTEQRTQAEELLLRYRDVFSTGDFDIGHTKVIKHRIDLTNEVPFKQRHRRIPPSMYEEVKAYLQQLLDQNIIRESNSPWASAIVLVRKKSGGLRLCIDYRLLNQRTVKDSYALPRIDEMIDHLIGSKYFSSLDLRSGFFQVEVEEEHKPRTAFTAGPLGFYEFTRMPQGLTNSPATFQRLMARCLGDLHMKECFTFIDDIIVPGQDFEQELQRLERVFLKMRQNHLKLHPKKSVFFMRRAKYCGHIVSENGVETDPEKTAKISEWQAPCNIEQVRMFLGFSGYYRRFVKDYAKIARPLTDLLAGQRTSKARGRRKQEAIPWRWGEEQQQAFETLKACLTSPPVLAYADYEKPFILHTDASGHGLGAVLCQKQDDGPEKVIAYASRALSKSEKNYSAHKLEFLALKWSVTEKFHDYLYGNSFTVYTDNNPLTYVLTTAKLDATGHRWLAELQTYHFDIKYRPGVKNTDADVLSRLPGQVAQTQDEASTEDTGSQSAQSVEYQGISRESVLAICRSAVEVPLVETLCLSTQVLDSSEFDITDEMRPRDIRAAQRRDPVIKRILPFVTSGRKPAAHQFPKGREYQQFVKEFHNLTLRRGILHRATQVEGKEKLQLVIPREYRSLALKGLHDDIGHMGRDKTLDLVRDRFFWPRMASDVEDWVGNCIRCKVSKGTGDRAPLVNITTSQPLELVCLDYLTLEMSQGGFENVLVITDHFTRYAQAIPTRNQTAKTTAEAFINSFAVHYGLPRRIHTDQGRNFESKMIQEMCTVLGIEKSHTTSYHPMGNGMTEKFNQTLINMLKTLEGDKKVNWKAHVAPLVHAYNSSRHASTKQTPFFLMFGRQPRLPIDLILASPVDREEQSYGKFVDSLRRNLQAAYKLANAEADKARQAQKRRYDNRVRGGTIAVHDRVLVRVLAHEGKHKLADRWESQPYLVLAQPNPDIPVFIVQQEDGRGPRRTLHRNHLLPVSTLPFPEQPREDGDQQPKIVQKVKRPPENPEPSEPETPAGTDTETHSDSEDEFALFLEDAEPDVDDGASIAEGGEGESGESHRTETGESSETEAAESHVTEAGENSETEDVAHHPEATEVHSDERSSESEATDSEDEATETRTSGAESVHGSDVSDLLQSSSNEPSPQGSSSSSSTTPDAATKQPSPMPLRRGTRVRKKPKWFSGGDYVAKQHQAQLKQKLHDCGTKQVTETEWQRKADFLAKLAMTDTFCRFSDSFCDAILEIVSNK